MPWIVVITDYRDAALPLSRSLGQGKPPCFSALIALSGTRQSADRTIVLDARLRTLFTHLRRRGVILLLGEAC